MKTEHISNKIHLHQPRKKSRKSTNSMINKMKHHSHDHGDGQGHNHNHDHNSSHSSTSSSEEDMKLVGEEGEGEVENSDIPGNTIARLKEDGP